MKKVIVPAEEDRTPPSLTPAAASTSAVSPDPTASNQSQQERNTGQTVTKTRYTERGPSNLVPPDVLNVLGPSLKVGASVGAVGVFAGAAGAIVRSSPVVLWSAISGLQWFTLGSSYYGSRQLALESYGGHEKATPFEKVKASAMAGGFAGVMGALLRGPRNVVPAAIFWSLAGAGGQAVAGSFSGQNLGAEFLASKWSPVTPLTDRQYESILEEKLLKLDAELAIIEDNMKALREGNR